MKRRKLSLFLLISVIMIQFALAGCVKTPEPEPQEPSEVCTLSGIIINGVNLQGFSSATLTYTVKLAYDTVDIPEIQYVLTDEKSSATVTLPTELPGNAIIRVLAEDNYTTKTYTVQINLEDPPVSIEYIYQGEPTVAPYFAKNADGTPVKNPDGTPILDTDGNPRESFNSMFFAIHFAGLAGASDNETYVVDSLGTEIFRRRSQNMFHKYDGTNFVGVAPSEEAYAWGRTRERSYVVNGRGTAYMSLGEKKMPGGTDETPPYELNAGSYNYMFSKHGELKNAVWSDGYGYMSCYVRLSEAVYKAAQDKDKGWNAYIFINHNGGYNIDLGLIGNAYPADKVVRWKLVRNCSYDEHKTSETEPGFKVWHSEIVSEMQYNAADDTYINGDDLFFEVVADPDGWLLTITNLRTNKKFTIDERHPNFHKDKTQYFRFLLAASYCPVRGDMWNARCGAVLNNVVFDNVKISRYRADKNYSTAVMEDFYPNEPTLRYGFAQGADAADFEFGTRAAGGTYKSGQTYNAGDKFVSFSTFYDGSRGLPK